VQHGTLQVPGLNRPTGGADDDLFDIDAALFALATDWAALADAAPDPDLLQRSRQSADLPSILDAFAGATIAGAASEATLASGFERLLLVQLETVLQRERSGAGTLRLEAIERSVNAAIAADELPAAARTLFATLCQRVRRGNGVSGGDDPALHALVAAHPGSARQDGCPGVHGTGGTGGGGESRGTAGPLWPVTG